MVPGRAEGCAAAAGKERLRRESLASKHPERQTVFSSDHRKSTFKAALFSLACRSNSETEDTPTSVSNQVVPHITVFELQRHRRLWRLFAEKLLLRWRSFRSNVGGTARLAHQRDLASTSNLSHSLPTAMPIRNRLIGSIFSRGSASAKQVGPRGNRGTGSQSCTQCWDIEHNCFHNVEVSLSSPCSCSGGMKTCGAPQVRTAATSTFRLNKWTAITCA